MIKDVYAAWDEKRCFCDNGDCSHPPYQCDYCKGFRAKAAKNARLVYCKYCTKTHAVLPYEEPCSPGAWINA